jgi:antitoxin component of MazEF toxin-antitoxin module
MKNVGNRYDFAGPFRDRNWAIYRMRVVEKRTLSSIGAQYNISRERVRQIVVRATNLIKHKSWAEAAKKTKGMTPVGALNISSRVQNVLKNMQLYDLPVRLFVDTVTPQELIKEPTFGRRSLKELIAAIEEVDPDVSNLWTAGHGQNYNPAKYGR